MLRLAVIIALGLLSAMMLGGCYQSPAIALHEPGEYEGSADPLQARLKNFELQQQLEERLRQGQTDR